MPFGAPFHSWDWTLQGVPGSDVVEQHILGLSWECGRAIHGWPVPTPELWEFAEELCWDKCCLKSYILLLKSSLQTNLWALQLAWDEPGTLQWVKALANSSPSVLLCDFIPSILIACLWWGFKGKRLSICSSNLLQEASRAVGSQQQNDCLGGKWRLCRAVQAHRLALWGFAPLPAGIYQPAEQGTWTFSLLVIQAWILSSFCHTIWRFLLNQCLTT